MAEQSEGTKRELRSCFKAAASIQSNLFFSLRTLEAMQRRSKTPPEELQLPSGVSYKTNNKEILDIHREVLNTNLDSIVDELKHTNCGFSEDSEDRIKEYVADVKKKVDEGNYSSAEDLLAKLRVQFSLADKYFD